MFCFRSPPPKKSRNPEFADWQKKRKKCVTLECGVNPCWSVEVSVIDSRMDGHDPLRANKLFNQFVGAAMQISDSRDAGDKQAPAHRNTAGGEIRS